MKVKKIIVCAGIATFFSVSALAQKGELSTAKNSFESYDMLRSANNGAMVKNSLNKAKVAIDKASQHEKTSALPETYALRAAIYAHTAMLDTVESTSAPIFAAAEEALAKAKELDTKKENEAFIISAENGLAQSKLNSGVVFYGQKKFDDAYKAFEYSQKYGGDTTAIYYAGISAAAANNPLVAIEQYKKLLQTNYSALETVYLDMSTLYLSAKDSVNAVKIAGEAVQKYPASAELRKREIEISLQTGQTAEVLSKLEKAIAADPKNKTLYMYSGLTYTQMADALHPKASKTKDAAARQALIKEEDDNFAKAAEMYKKAIELDPEYFDAILNMGYVSMKPAINTYNEAQQLPQNKQKEYDAAVAKSKVQFDAAKPYLEKATELQPKSIDAWLNLRMYYIGIQNQAKANELQKTIDELSK